MTLKESQGPPKALRGPPMDPKGAPTDGQRPAAGDGWRRLAAAGSWLVAGGWRRLAAAGSGQRPASGWRGGLSGGRAEGVPNSHREFRQEGPWLRGW